MVVREGEVSGYILYMFDDEPSVAAELLRPS